MNYFASRYAFMQLALIIAAWPHAAYAQTMSFSYYTDAVVSSDLQTLYTTAGGYDNSSGCTHSDYQTYGSVSGPSGFFYDSFPGMVSYLDVPIPEEGGDYSIYSDLTVSCSCFGAGLGAGGASQVYYVVPFTARMKYLPAWSSPRAPQLQLDRLL